MVEHNIYTVYNIYKIFFKSDLCHKINKILIQFYKFLGRKQKFTVVMMIENFYDIYHTKIRKCHIIYLHKYSIIWILCIQLKISENNQLYLIL